MGFTGRVGSGSTVGPKGVGEGQAQAGQRVWARRGTAPAQRRQWLSVWVSPGTQGALVPRRPLGGLPTATPSTAPSTGRDLRPGRACLLRSQHLTHSSNTHGRPLGPRPTRDSQTGPGKRGEGRRSNSSSGARGDTGGAGGHHKGRWKQEPARQRASGRGQAPQGPAAADPAVTPRGPGQGPSK